MTEVVTVWWRRRRVCQGLERIRATRLGTAGFPSLPFASLLPSLSPSPSVLPCVEVAFPLLSTTASLVKV